MQSFKRYIAKSVISTVYHQTLTVVSTAAITAVVQPEEDSIEEAYCELGGLVTASAIWWKTTGRVQSIVDVVADKHIERKAAKQTKSTEE